MRNRALLPLLLASGATGITYELLWTRLLSLSFGSTTQSFSTVLAVFFGGMALGSWLGGRLASRLTRPARAYGLIEGALGVLGLVSYPAMLRLDDLLAWLGPQSSLAVSLARVLISGLLLAAPTVLMGATLPVVSRAVIHSDAMVGRGTALIYALNTLGAFVGTYAVTFHLLPHLGILGTMLITVATNGGVASLAVGVDRRAARREDPSLAAPHPPPATGTGEPATRTVRLASLLTFFNGFALISLEVIWTRTFASLLQGTVYGLGAVLMAVLAGIGLGAFAWSRAAPTVRHPALVYVALQSVTVLAVAAVFWWFVPLAYLLESLSAYSSLASVHYQLIAVLVCLVVPAFCSGASLPLLVQLVEGRAARSSAALGWLLAANTLGAIAGSLLTGFVLIPTLASPGSVTLALSLLTASALLAALLLCRGSLRLVAAALAAVSFLVLAHFDGYDNQIVGATRKGHESFSAYVARQAHERRNRVYFSEGRDVTIGVSLMGDALGLQLNGLGQGGRHFEPPHYIEESALLAALSLIHSHEPRTAMVVGLGSGVTVDALSRSGVERVTVLEIEEGVARGIEGIWQGKTPLGRAGVELVVDDARHHLVANARREERRYDIIASMPSHPWVAPNIFTREFFDLAGDNLSERGIFISWVGYPSLDGPTVKSLFRAFTASFPHYFVYQFDTLRAYYLIGSRGPLGFDVSAVERLATSGVFEREDTIGNAVYLASNVHATGDETTAPVPAGPVNTDDSAFVETWAPRRTTEPPLVEGFFPRANLVPGEIEGADTGAFLISLLETLLGTPEGRLPVRSWPAHPARAARTIAAAGGDLLTPQERDFYRGRALLNDPARRQEGLESLDRAARGEDAETATRARLFAALAQPRYSAARRDALLALPPSRDVALAVLDEVPDQWRRFAPATIDSPEKDQVGWLLAPRLEGGSELRPLLVDAIPILLGAEQLHLVERAERLARERGWHPEADLLRGRAVDLARARAIQLRSMGTAAARQGNHARALDLLRRAIHLAPADRVTLETLVEVAAREGDEVALGEARRLYVTLGRSPEYVAELAERARTLGLGHLDAPEPTGESVADPPPPPAIVRSPSP